MQNKKEIIKAQGIKKSYRLGGNTVEVLRDVNFDLNESEVVSIVGASGTGKSTLLHILGLLDNCDSGSIYYDGRNIDNLTDEEKAEFRNKNIGFVFQFHHLLMEFTSLENVMIPLLISGIDRKEAQARAASVLADVGLEGRMKHRPSELSGGEQQRVAIARALVMHPRVVLADEPTGNLDSQTGESVFELLKDLNKRKNESFVIATHNLELAKRSDKVFRLEKGILTEIDF
ncbi:MAG: ABC transporter ATP-binding protein [Candidatus Schekmanbacteria bacterium]|nr:MAG: ABC transporter ATP-binding protein [Candidatus Schekmanbacteria bacterium]